MLVSGIKIRLSVPAPGACIRRCAAPSHVLRFLTGIHSAVEAGDFFLLPAEVMVTGACSYRGPALIVASQPLLAAGQIRGQACQIGGLSQVFAIRRAIENAGMQSMDPATHRSLRTGGLAGC